MQLLCRPMCLHGKLVLQPHSLLVVPSYQQTFERLRKRNQHYYQISLIASPVKYPAARISTHFFPPLTHCNKLQLPEQD